MPHKRAKSRGKKSSFNKFYFIPIGLGLLFVIAFWEHIFKLFNFGARFSWAVISVFFDLPLPNIPFENLQSVLPLALNCVGGFGLVLAFWLFLIAAQAILPVSSFRDTYRGSFRLFLHMIKRHGQAVFVDDGKKLSTPGELDKPGQGVVVVDFNSAVVLEEKVATPNILLKIGEKLALAFRLIDPYQSPRIHGPGLVFTRRNERIREAVDLREQFRMRNGVQAYTRDGIEMVMDVHAAFTIGQKPDCLEVIYIGEPRAENLRIAQLRWLPTGRMKLMQLSNDLDDVDRYEIHQYARVAARLGHMQPYYQLPDPRALPEFDRERVFKAVFSQARDNEDQLMPWYDLPVKVTTDVVLDELLKINYDDLYHTENPGDYPLKRLFAVIQTRMRNLGLLNYRLIARVDGMDIRVGDELSYEELICTPVRGLENSKVLRDRGIKVLSGGLKDMRPVSEAVYRQHLDTWRARWESDTEIIRASRDLEASRIRSRARAKAQAQMVSTLSHIFDSEQYSQEAMAIRVLQALEQIASDPKTRQLLPGDTIRLLGMVHDWLLPNDVRSVSIRPPLIPPGEEGGSR